MRTKARKTGVAIFSAVLAASAAGCLDSDGRSSSAAGGKMTVNNDDESLSDRLAPRNDTIQIDTTVATPKRAATKSLTLTLTAEIKSPVLGGDTLQATSVHLSGGFAYVSYNLQGERYRGGVDVIQIKSGSKAELRSQVLFDSADVHSLYYNGDLYLAQGQANANPPAMVEKLEINGGKIVVKPRVRAQLSSFAATSVTTSGSKVWVTTGNAGRLYSLTSDLKKIDSTAVLADARWVDYDGALLGRIVVAQGSPCRLQSYGLLTFLSPNNVTVGGCNIPQSKTTVRVFPSGRALVAAGDSGVRIINLNTGATIGALPRIKVTGIDSTQTVTNAVDGAGTLVYASNGEAGIYAVETSQSFDLSPATTTLNVIGKLKFAGFQSANHVAFDGNTLVVAAGRGGVKIVAVKWE